MHHQRFRSQLYCHAPAEVALQNAHKACCWLPVKTAPFFPTVPKPSCPREPWSIVNLLLCWLLLWRRGKLQIAWWVKRSSTESNRDEQWIWSLVPMMMLQLWPKHTISAGGRVLPSWCPYSIFTNTGGRINTGHARISYPSPKDRN